MEYMESKMQEQYDAQNELIKELDALRNERDALAAHNSAYAKTYFRFQDLCNELIDHLRYNKCERSEVLDDFWNKLDAIGLPNSPRQCLRDVQAEAGRKGYIACLNFACHTPDNWLSLADKYAESVRQGGAE